MSPLSPIGNGIAGRNNAWWALTERPYSRAGRFLQLIRRFAALAVQAENMEAKLALGLEINLADHALVSSTLVRLASRLGINRRSKVRLSRYPCATTLRRGPRLRRRACREGRPQVSEAVK